MEQVEIELTGFAQVKVSRTMKVSKAHAQTVLSDDAAMQSLLAMAVNCEVIGWGEVFAKREPLPAKQANGFQCLTFGCSWIGTEEHKRDGFCPRCGNANFHKVQEVTQRG
ncbi:hypothetical protein [Pseudoalteromonas phenolica]|uniref:hypothetical protein n=1 Tax=Pseudoalteromonas phenolica TaxID=161398 RepID=UPI00110C01E4|nr:hypothetical protein [Pseudoalteromonas phenolica]TMO54120.1 hypothetical protein CWC21_16680 [Pseudoalteromonas phenolica]